MLNAELGDVARAPSPVLFAPPSRDSQSGKTQPPVSATSQRASTGAGAGRPRTSGALRFIQHSAFNIQHFVPAAIRADQEREREGQWVSCEAERRGNGEAYNSYVESVAPSDNEADGPLPFARPKT
jgi:hypothetical protein